MKVNYLLIMNIYKIILYTTPQGEIKIRVFLHNETVWLTKRTMGELFGFAEYTISEHFLNIYKSRELEKEAFPKIRTVQKEAGREVNRNL